MRIRCSFDTGAGVCLWAADEAARLAYAARDAFVADPQHMNVPASYMLSDGFIDALAPRIDRKSRRVGLGMTVDSQVIPYESPYRAVPMSELEEALHNRVYRPDPTARRRQELGHLVKEVLPDIYRDAYEHEVTPATVFNTRSAPRG